MTTIRPTHITPPSMEAYPYIRMLYENIDCKVPGEHDQQARVGKYLVSDQNDFDKIYEGYSGMGASQIGAFGALSDETFSALCAGLKPRIGPTEINSKADVAMLAADVFENLDEDEPATLEQVQANLFETLNFGKNTQWGKLAEVYNASSDDQQQAIIQFFSVLQNRNIVEILATKAPEYESLPTLEEAFETKTFPTGEVGVFDTLADRWIREDVFINKFQVLAVETNYQDTIIASAPTLALALARAIRAVDTLGTKAPRKVDITSYGHYIAVGEIEFTAGTHPKVKDSDPRVNWKHWDKRPSKNEKGGHSTVEFKRILYKAEAALGIQRSKVADLENDLGL